MPPKRATRKSGVRTLVPAPKASGSRSLKAKPASKPTHSAVQAETEVAAEQPNRSSGWDAAAGESFQRYNLRKRAQDPPVASNQLGKPSVITEHRIIKPAGEAGKPPPRLLQRTNPRISEQIKRWADGIPETSLLLNANTPKPAPVGLKNIPDWYYDYEYEFSEHSGSTNESSNISEQFIPDSMEGTVVSTPKDLTKLTVGKKKCCSATEKMSIQALVNRNVSLRESKDDHTTEKLRAVMAKIEGMRTKSKEFIRALDESNERWEADMQHCTMENEAVFQRTLMVDMISRHTFDNTLYYTCEKQWVCRPMPSKGPRDILPMSNPRPDLGIAFSMDTLVPDDSVLFKLRGLQNYICPVAQTETAGNCGFYFFSIEAKGLQGDDAATTVASRQNLNTASQALYNMFYFMDSAGQADLFFENVRFFSIAATARRFLVRVHRAERYKDKPGVENPFPLRYQYYQILDHSGTYTKADATKLINAILHDYGVKILLPIMQDTIKKALSKTEDFGHEISDNLALQESQGKGSGSKRRFEALEGSSDGQMYRDISGVRIAGDSGEPPVEVG